MHKLSRTPLDTPRLPYKPGVARPGARSCPTHSRADPLRAEAPARDERTEVLMATPTPGDAAAKRADAGASTCPGQCGRRSRATWPQNGACGGSLSGSPARTRRSRGRSLPLPSGKARVGQEEACPRAHPVGCG